MDVTRMKREDTVLIMVDFQEKLMPAMKNADAVSAKAAMLAEGCREFELPILVTQQYTKGMGATIEPVASVLGEFQHIEKKEFSCMLNGDFKSALADTGKRTAIVCGCETHVCIQQTVLDLLAEDYTVYVAADCVSSREEDTRDRALERMAGAGAIITNAETALFELLISADDPHFKAISKLVK